MWKGSARLSFTRKSWWVPVLVCCGATAIVIKVVWWRSKGVRRRQEQDDGSEVVGASNEADESVAVEEQDWKDLTHSTVGQESQSHDPTLQLLVEQCFPCDAVEVFRALYQPGSVFWTSWQRQQHHEHIRQGEWYKQSTVLGQDKWTREYNYRMPLNKLTSMGASFADNTEVQTVHHASREAWMLSVSAATANVPMANLFKCVVNIVAYSEAASGRPGCKVCVYGNVVFHKPQPLKEALVRRPALKGMRSTYDHMLQLLQEQLHLWRQEHVASVPLPDLQPVDAGHEQLLDTQQKGAQHRKLQPKGLYSTKAALQRDKQRAQDALQALFAALIFFVVLFVSEAATEANHHPGSWRQMPWPTEPSSAATTHTVGVLGALLQGGKPE